MRTRNTTTGSLLIVALWMLIIISAIVMAVSVYSGIEAKKTRAFGDRYAAVERARAAVSAARLLIESDGHPQQDDQNDGWYAFDRLSERITTDRFDALRVLIVDEERKFNLNGATPAMVEGLAKRINEADRVRDLSPDIFAQDVLAFRGLSDMAQASGFSTSQGRAFSSVRELLRLPNVPTAQMQALIPFVTVYPKVQNMMAVNINTASVEVLGAVMDGTLGDDGAKSAMLDAILAYRQGLSDTGAASHFTRDDLSAYKLLEGLGLQRDVALVSVAVQFLRWMTVDSTCFTILVSDPAAGLTVEAVVGPERGGLKANLAAAGSENGALAIYEWYEYCTETTIGTDARV